MKKNIFILFTALAASSLMAFGFMNWSGPAPEKPTSNELASEAANYQFERVGFLNSWGKPDLVYKIDSRYITTITKEKLHQASTILDILPAKATQSIASYENVKVAVLHDDETETVEMGAGESLNKAQLDLLKSTNYSNNFYIYADYKTKSPYTGKLIDEYLSYYITVVPEKQAEYIGGQDLLVDYLRASSSVATASIERDQLRPGQFNFTITKDGSISNVKLSSTSGYPVVDDALIELIQNTPGKWTPATNALGEYVEQEFVFFFGVDGC